MADHGVPSRPSSASVKSRAGRGPGGSKRAGAPESGSHLLSKLNELPKPLAAWQVKEIARHLDGLVESGAGSPSSPGAFKSKDLKIGKRRQAPEQSTFQDSSWGHSQVPSVERFDLNIQQAAFEFVKSDAQIEIQIKYPQAWIVVAGMQRKLHHYQLYAAFLVVMDFCGSRRGLIEADRMGLGKTTITYVILYFNYLLLELEKDWLEHPERHRTEDGKACSSPWAKAIVCPCDPNGVTARLHLKGRPGTTLVLAPKRLLSTWKQEWRSVDITGMSLFIQHSEFPEDAVPHYRRRCLALVKVEGEDGSAIMQIRSDSQAHNMIVLTTVGQYWRRVQHHFRLWRPLIPAADAHVLPYKKRTDGICWATVVQDEAHLQVKRAVRFQNLLRSLAASGWVKPAFIALTATPMLRNGPKDMLFLVKAINMMSPNISEHPECAEFTDEETLEQLCKDFTTMRRAQARGIADPQLVNDVRARVGTFHTAYALQRRATTTQNNKVLVQLPPLAMYDVSCPSRQKDRYRIWQVEEFLKDTFTQSLDDETEITLTRLLNHSTKARILADVPGLALYGSKELITWSYISSQGWHSRPQESPFARDLDELEQSSGKLQMLRRIIASLGHDASGCPEKLVVISEFPVICLIVVVLCLDIGIECQWVHAGLSAAKREWLASNFQETRHLQNDPHSGQQELPIRVIVGTLGVLGCGLTLHKAIRLVLMEPNRSLEVEMQAAARSHRLGVVTDQCWFYRLHNPESALEQLLMQDQHQQLENNRIVQWFAHRRALGDAVLPARERALLQAYSTFDESDEDARDTISAEDLERQAA